MKEKIIIDKEKVIAFRPKGLDVYSQEYVEEIDVIENTKKVEPLPETFEDVKQLTKEHIEKLKLNKDVWEIDIQKDFIDIQKKYVTYRVRFTSIGNILFDAYLKIAENKTPNELWSFIKSLIGEE